MDTVRDSHPAGTGGLVVEPMCFQMTTGQTEAEIKAVTEKIKQIREELIAELKQA